MKKLYTFLILFCSIFSIGHAATPTTATGTVTFDYHTAYTAKDMTGYLINGGKMSISNVGLLNIPKQAYTLSKKVTVGYREYEVVLEFVNPSPAVSGTDFTIPSNSYGDNVNLQIGKNVEFQIYVLNSQGDIAGSITSIQFCSPTNYRAAYYNNISLASNNGNETFSDWNTTYYVKWWRPTDKNKAPIQKPHFRIGTNTPNQYKNYGLELEYLKVSFQPTDYAPFTPMILTYGGHETDANSTIHFINDINATLALQPEDAAAKMDLFMHYPQLGDNRLAPPVDNAHKISDSTTVKISDNTTLWCYAANNASWSYFSSVNEIIFDRLEAIEFPDIPSLTGVKKGQTPPVNNDYTRRTVTFTDSLMVDGILLTDQHNYYNYFKDRNGNMIRVVSTDTIPGLREGQLIAPKGIAGRYLHTQGTPEIDITGFEKYCAVTDTNSSILGFPEPETRYSTELQPGERLFDKSDFNKHLIISNVTYRDGARIEDANGVTYPLYIRFLDYPLPADIQPGDNLWMEGYIGKNGLEISFMPIHIEKCAPRPFIRYKTGNRISGETPVVSVSENRPITWTIDEDEDITYKCLINYGGKINPASNWIEPRDITIADFTNTLPDGRKYCDLAVAANFGDSYNISTSTVERIRFIKEEAIEIASIKDFKPLYQSGGVNTPGADYNTYYVITGEVVIEDAASSNLLLRDNVPESSDIKTGQKYHLLVYNENGWSQPEVSVIENGVRVKRPLKEGDVISSFVIRPELTSYDLFRGNATGFARTYTLAPDVKEVTKSSDRTVNMTYDPKDAASDTYYEKILLDYWNILLPFKFENVAIGCRENPKYETAAVQPDGARIDADGNPVSQYIYQMVVGENLDIDFLTFPDRIGGFTTSYDMAKFKAANGDVTKYPTYDINAIVIKNPIGNDSGATTYAMALTDFGGVDEAEAPAA
ncbi:MAG: hypothetical protein K2H84_00190, partial [Paramuribaculum sp.]|nr:hypothetical protein [Paramuribaculum sp.]